MTKLSINVNKIATLRNSRGENNPNLIQVVKNIEQFGADGITVHPRPDERHIKYADVNELAKTITTEFNIEGNPTEKKFVQLVLDNLPTQVTLVPDNINQLTSNHGWNVLEEKKFLSEIIPIFKKNNIRVSIFIDPIEKYIPIIAEIGADRVELYTYNFAKDFEKNRLNASMQDYINTALLAESLGIGVNAGHDLSLKNLAFFKQKIPQLKEVSIGHALICDALYSGLENTIQMYKRQLK
ncbi:MAG: pyridoxine 5'-phosphate synthase [Sediminibacterium sp.]|nr:pyridoxine 5'-phosphate synthase [Sediminibacterium sp.]